MTVQELASKMNELMRGGMSKWQVRTTSDNRIYYPILDIGFNNDSTVKEVIVLTSIKRPENEGIPIEKSDLERYNRATYDPKE